MLQAFIVTLREGLEAFLIVAISLAYLRKSGRDDLRRAVYWGIGVSAATSLTAGYLFSLASNQALWEGILAITAALLVGTLVIQMWRSGSLFQRRIYARLDSAAAESSNAAAWFGVFAFIVLMITREGMEAALLLGTLLFQMRAMDVFAGAAGGLVAAGGIALLWARYGHRVNLRRFLQVTAMFLLLFVLQLAVYGFHELAEADLFPHAIAIHDATEPYGPDGVYGTWLTFGLVAIPLGWLAAGALVERSRRPRAPVRSVAASS